MATVELSEVVLLCRMISAVHKSSVCFHRRLLDWQHVHWLHCAVVCSWTLTTRRFCGQESRDELACPRDKCRSTSEEFQKILQCWRRMLEAERGSLDASQTLSSTTSQQLLSLSFSMCLLLAHHYHHRYRRHHHRKAFSLIHEQHRHYYCRRVAKQ